MSAVASTSSSNGGVKRLDAAVAMTDKSEKEKALVAILEERVEDKNDEQLREKEQAILQLGQLYRDNNDAPKVANLIKQARPLMEHLAKAKTAKLIRTMLDFFTTIPNSRQIQIDATKENADWAKQEKRIFLKQSLETRLVGLYIDTQAYRDALALITSLLKELKKLDDKMILTEVHLLESRVHHALSNMPKARAALTSARTAANAIYCPPLLQAQLDMQSGVLHAEDKDYKTAFSYFFEALEGFSSQDDAQATPALKYMLLCKVMLNLPEDVASIVSSKLAQRYAGPDIDAIKAVAKAHEDSSLAQFEKLLRDHKKELRDDPIIRNHLSALYDTLLEQNLLRLIEPYSRVEIAHVAKLVEQPVTDVEAKLSQMILDKVFYGILDQGAGSLIVYDEPVQDKTYDDTLATMGHLSQTVDHLFARAAQLA